MIESGWNIGKRARQVQGAGGGSPSLFSEESLAAVSTGLCREIQGHESVEQRTEFGTILDQHRYINRSSAQNGWQSEYRHMKRSGIALELDCAAIRPSCSGEKQEQKENEPGPHHLLGGHCSAHIHGLKDDPDSDKEEKKINQRPG